MAQHDYVLDNQSGAEFRADLNNALSAIVSQNSGAFEPTTTYAYMLWADTTSNQLKQRNAANTDWVVLQELDGTLLMESGTENNPGLAFASDKDTGFYRLAANKLGISTGGSTRILIDDQKQVLFGTTTGSWSSRAVFFGDTTFGTFAPTVTLAYGSANPTDDTVVGDIYFNDSSAGSPGAIIRATADANWGTYQPTRIEFHVSSASAGVGEVMRIDSEGRLGLGTSTPVVKLDIQDTSGTTNAPVIIQNISALSSGTVANGFGPAIRFQGEDAGGSNRDMAYVSSVYTNAGTVDTALTFYTRDNLGALTEKVRIDEQGRVGIGTSSPGNILEGRKDQNAGTKIVVSNQTNGANALAGIDLQAYGGGWQVEVPASATFVNPLNFSFNGSPKAVLTAGGALGLGTSTPSRSLTNAGGVTLTTGTAPQYRLNGTAADGDDDDRAIFGLATAASQFVSTATIGDAILRTTNGGNLLFGEGITERVRIDSSGRVGIGTTVANSKLSIGNASSTNDGLTITFTGDNSTLARFYADTSTGEVSIGAIAGSYFPTFYAAGSEKARIDTSGRLLVGISSGANLYDGIDPQFQLEGTGIATSSASLFCNSNDANGPFLLLGSSRGTADGSATIVQSGDTLGAIEFVGADNTDRNTPGGLIKCEVDGTPGANDMPGRLVFSTTADGASSPTEQLRITSDRYVRLAAGTGGIQFGGDTAAANALDDYEEGTWTPSLGGTATYTVQDGNYTKVGRLVNIRCNIAVNLIGTGSTYRISGLPFTPATTSTSNPNAFGVVGYFQSLAVSPVYISTFASSGGTTINVTGLTAAGATASSSLGVFGNSARIDFTMTYYAG